LHLVPEWARLSTQLQLLHLHTSTSTHTHMPSGLGGAFGSNVTQLSAWPPPSPPCRHATHLRTMGPDSVVRVLVPNADAIGLAHTSAPPCLRIPARLHLGGWLRLVWKWAALDTAPTFHTSMPPPSRLHMPSTLPPPCLHTCIFRWTQRVAFGFKCERSSRHCHTFTSTPPPLHTELGHSGAFGSNGRQLSIEVPRFYLHTCFTRLPHPPGGLSGALVQM
jgi:hypothetical protein